MHTCCARTHFQPQVFSFYRPAQPLCDVTFDPPRFFQMWFDLGHGSRVFWISGLFFPKAFFFLTGAMHNFARKYGKEIGLLSFSRQAMDHISDAPCAVDCTTTSDLSLFEGHSFNHELRSSTSVQID